MALFCTKSVVVQAVMWHGYNDGDIQIVCHSFARDGDTLTIPTAEGPRQAAIGDWVVRDANGATHLFTPSEFWARYEPVGSASER